MSNQIKQFEDVVRQNHKTVFGFPVIERSSCTVKFNDEMSVLVVLEDDVHECFLKKEGYSYRYMFGLPADKQSMSGAAMIAVANAMSYMDLFDEE